MNREQTNAHLSAILETLADAHGGQASGGIIAAALTTAGVSEKDCRALRDILIAGKLVTPQPGHLLVITDRGREMVKKIRGSKAALTGAYRYRVAVRLPDIAIDRIVTWKNRKIAGATDHDGNDVTLAPYFKKAIAAILRAHTEKNADKSVTITIEPA